MRIYLAVTGLWLGQHLYDEEMKRTRPYILASYYYVEKDNTASLIPYCGDFLLDSGAFTFMSGSHGGAVNWDEYVERYAAYIKTNSIKKYFELDIDVVVGYKRVLELRQKLERLTGSRCIPVWHKSRGRQEFFKMCEEYPYVAVGGIVSGEIRPPEYPIFGYLIKEAHSRGAKIHALGFTNMNGMKKYHFDSVDSTAWSTGNRYGFIYKYRNGGLEKHYPAPKGARLSDVKAVALNNFVEWVKFQKWADVHL